MTLVMTADTANAPRLGRARSRGLLGGLFGRLAKLMLMAAVVQVLIAGVMN